MNTDKISLIGLGKLGLPLLSTFAYHGQKIIGIDVDKNKINILNNNELPFYENNLKEYLIGGRDNIEYSFCFDEVIDKTDVVIILVAHNIFKKMGIQKIKMLANNKNCIIMDIKSIFPKGEVDFQL